MRQYERSGVIIDQCGECRGIFLDRGELEKLFEAEANWQRQQRGAPTGQAAQRGTPQWRLPAAAAAARARPAPARVRRGAPPPPAARPAAAPRARVRPGQQHYGYHGHYKRKKHKGFLGRDCSAEPGGRAGDLPARPSPGLPAAVPSGPGRGMLRRMTSGRHEAARARRTRASPP